VSAIAMRGDGATATAAMGPGRAPLAAAPAST
jgi:hypothetical protein